jgi:hypothetical protein
MMKLICVLAGVLIWTTPLMAETYSWVDKNGTYNFTEDYSRVPKKYRGRVNKRGDMGATPQSKESVSPSNQSGAAPLAASKKSNSGKLELPEENFGGKSYDQWKQELGEREAAMGAVKKRVDEIDVLLRNHPTDKEQTQNLISERNKAVEKFTGMRKEYDQHVERARKAGVQVDITK